MVHILQSLILLMEANLILIYIGISMLKHGLVDIPSGSGFAAGDTIVVRVKDNFGCIDSIAHVFTEPDSLIIQNVSPSIYTGGPNVSCLVYLMVH